MKVAVVGGTGDFGLALAQRLAGAGVEVVIGSRDAARAQEKAAEAGAASGATNEDAVRGVDLVVLATKAEAALETAASLAAAIGYPDMVSLFAGTVLNQTGQAIETIAITMGVYLVISLVISLLMNIYNRKIALVER